MGNESSAPKKEPSRKKIVVRGPIIVGAGAGGGGGSSGGGSSYSSAVSDVASIVSDPAETWAVRCRRAVERDRLHNHGLLPLLLRMHPEGRRVKVYRLRYDAGYGTIVRVEWDAEGIGSGVGGGGNGGGSGGEEEEEGVVDAFVDVNVTLQPCPTRSTSRIATNKNRPTTEFAAHETILASPGIGEAGATAFVELHCERSHHDYNDASSNDGRAVVRPFPLLRERTRVLRCREHGGLPGCVDQFEIGECGEEDFVNLPTRCVNLDQRRRRTTTDGSGASAIAARDDDDGDDETQEIDEAVANATAKEKEDEAREGGDEAEDDDISKNTNTEAAENGSPIAAADDSVSARGGINAGARIESPGDAPDLENGDSEERGEPSIDGPASRKVSHSERGDVGERSIDENATSKTRKRPAGASTDAASSKAGGSSSQAKIADTQITAAQEPGARKDEPGNNEKKKAGGGGARSSPGKGPAARPRRKAKSAAASVKISVEVSPRAKSGGAAESETTAADPDEGPANPKGVGDEGEGEEEPSSNPVPKKEKQQRPTPRKRNRERDHPTGEDDAHIEALPAEGLPSGWTKRRVPRGETSNLKDTRYYSPRENYKFRTKKDALRFVGTLEEVSEDGEAEAMLRYNASVRKKKNNKKQEKEEAVTHYNLLAKKKKNKKQEEEEAATLAVPSVILVKGDGDVEKVEEEKKSPLRRERKKRRITYGRQR